MKYYFVRQLTSISRYSDKEQQINHTDIDCDLYTKKSKASAERLQVLYELMKNLSSIGNVTFPINSLEEFKELTKKNKTYTWTDEKERVMELTCEKDRLHMEYRSPINISQYDFLLEEIEEENIFYIFAKQNITYRNFKPDLVSIMGTNKENMLKRIEELKDSDKEQIYYDYNLQIVDKTNINAFNKLMYLCCEKVFTNQFSANCLEHFDSGTITYIQSEIRKEFLKNYQTMKETNNRLHYEKMMLNSRIQQLEDELHNLQYPQDIFKRISDDFMFEKPKNFKEYNQGITIPF